MVLFDQSHIAVGLDLYSWCQELLELEQSYYYFLHICEDSQLLSPIDCIVIGIYPHCC